MNEYKKTCFEALTRLEDDARAALIDRFFGVSDGQDAATRISILMQKGAMSRAFLLGDPDPHIVNMLTNEANATGRTPHEVASSYYEDQYLPFMEAEANMAVFAFNMNQQMEGAESGDEINAVLEIARSTAAAFIAAQYE